MSDFVRVNLKNGCCWVVSKCFLKIFSNNQGRYFARDLIWTIDKIGYMLSRENIERKGLITEFADLEEITREEYDRLCKELGVE